jgi:hypothetical protein
MSKKKLTSAQIIASTFGEIDSDTDSDIDITSKKWTTKKSLAEVPKASSESNSSQKPDASAPNMFFRQNSFITVTLTSNYATI